MALNPALMRKRSAAQWLALPTPEEEKVTFSLLALATRSSAVRMPLDAATSSTLGTVPNRATPAKSLTVS